MLSLSTSNRDQRREYKSKFVDLDVEFQRMRDRMEMMNQMLDDLHVSLSACLKLNWIKTATPPVLKKEGLKPRK